MCPPYQAHRYPVLTFSNPTKPPIPRTRLLLPVSHLLLLTPDCCSNLVYTLKSPLPLQCQQPRVFSPKKPSCQFSSIILASFKTPTTFFLRNHIPPPLQCIRDFSPRSPDLGSSRLLSALYTRRCYQNANCVPPSGRNCVIDVHLYSSELDGTTRFYGLSQGAV